MIPQNDRTKLLSFFLLALLLVIMLSMLASSCTVLKNKQTQESKIDSSVTVKTEAKVESEVQTNNNIVTEVTETTKGSVTVPGDSSVSFFTLNDLLNGKTIESEDNGIKTEIKLDPKTKKATVKTKTDPKNVPVEKKVVTRKEENLSKNEKVKSNIKEDISVDVEKSDKEVAVQTKTDWFAGINFNWLWLLLIPVIGYFIWRFRDKLFKPKK